MARKPSRVLHVRISENMYEKLAKSAAIEKIPISELVREYVGMGLNNSAYEQSEQRYLEHMRGALEEILNPAINRIAAISVKGGITSSAAYFLSAIALEAFVHPSVRKDFNDAITEAKKLGVRYMQVKENSVSEYLDEGLKKISKENKNEE